MWDRLKNLFFSFRTYKSLSPDFKVRQQVNRSLQHRPALNLDQWFETFYKPQGIAYPVVAFAYTHLKQYSGLEFGRVLPDDRLHEDLHWSSVCWFDWEIQLCDDFCQTFDIDLSSHLVELNPSTVAEFVLFLNHSIGAGQRLGAEKQF